MRTFGVHYIFFVLKTVHFFKRGKTQLFWGRKRFCRDLKLANVTNQAGGDIRPGPQFVPPKARV